MVESWQVLDCMEKMVADLDHADLYDFNVRGHYNDGGARNYMSALHQCCPDVKVREQVDSFCDRVAKVQTPARCSMVGIEYFDGYSALMSAMYEAVLMYQIDNDVAE